MPSLTRKKTVTKKPTSNKKAATPKKASNSTRDVLYLEPKSLLCTGEDAITVARAKELLGWQEEGEKDKFGAKFLLKDLHGKKIRCNFNVTNRPIYPSVIKTLMQEHLRKRWRLNGEPIIVGRTGLILNGQHTLISLVLASQEWHSNKEKWLEYWDEEPVMEKLIVTGIDEDDETVNTMDTCKPRSLSDVIYRSEFFKDKTQRDRNTAAKLCDNAIKMLWFRTGASKNTVAPLRTHSEAVGFLKRHLKLVECVNFIQDENDGEKSISQYLTPGYAAAMLYLMGSGSSEPTDYVNSDNPNESLLDWTLWDKATDFMVLLSGKSDDIRAFRQAHLKLVKMHEGTPTVAESLALVSKAWRCYSEGKKLTSKLLSLKYQENEGIQVLVECPTVGGIDIGDPSEIDTVAQKPDAVEEKPNKNSAPKRASKAGDDWAVNDKAWAFEDEETYFGTIVESWETSDGSKMVMLRDDAGKDWEIAASKLYASKPK